MVSSYCKKDREFSGISLICSNQATKFENSDFNSFCTKHRIKHEFFAPKTPLQNGVVESKNRVVQEMACVMLHSKNIPLRFWAEAVNTTVHVISQLYLTPRTKNASYEIWTGIKLIVKYFRTFGSKCYILSDREHLRKFNSQSDEGIFLAYSLTIKAYQVCNLKSSIVMESIDVVVDDAGTSDYFSEDNDGMIFSPMSK